MGCYNLVRKYKAQSFSFRIPISNHKLLGFGYLISKITEFYHRHLCTFINHVLVETLQSIIIDDYLYWHQDISIEFQDGYILERR